MALSNRFGGLLLTTGNKSEYAVGYATIYGDMCGGFAPIKDLYKTEVVALCRWRNAQSPAIPEVVITRPPSAELRDNRADGITAWYAGYLTPSDEYAGMYQGLGANPTWTADLLANTIATGVTTPAQLALGG